MGRSCSNAKYVCGWLLVIQHMKHVYDMHIQFHA